MKETGKEGGIGMKENRKPGRRIVRTVGTFALGAAVGSTLALLFAPASGRVTRKRIALKIRTLQRSTTRQLGQAQKLLARKAESLRDAASEKLTHARAWVVERVTNGFGRRPARQRAVRHA
jgi:gas vesicle protein